MKYAKFIGKDVTQVTKNVSSYRIKYFKEYPYLYDGNLEYEMEYFHEFSKEPNAFIEIVQDDANRLVGIVTGIPLKSSADIIKDTKSLFKSHNILTDQIFYLGEIIVDPSLRGSGIARQLNNDVEDYARQCGCTRITIATVVRQNDDKRKPSNYQSSDPIWIKLGYVRMNLFFDYHWPTFLESGEVRDINNTMEFWIKDI